MAEDQDPGEAPPAEGIGRRRFVALSTTTLMGGGLAAGYGMFAHIAGRFLYPAKPEPRAWLFVSEVSRLAPGASMVYKTPAGAKVAIARRGSAGGAADFVALGSTCPHLGCQVHWEPQNNRFFCPCHNGVFDPSGRAVAGPPAEAGQSLPLFPLKVENGLLYIEVPVPTVAAAEPPGQDPCLFERFPGGPAVEV